MNGKFYIGIHSTNDIDDNYMGSGVVIKAALMKYGTDNFSKEIIKQFNTRDEALAFEKKLVTEDLVRSEDCYNLRTGGSSGFVYSEEWLKIVSERAKKNHYKSINSETAKLKRAEANRRRAAAGEYSTPERCEKIRQSILQQRDEISIRVKKDWEDPEHRKMRCEKMKGVQKKLKTCPHCGKQMRANLERHIKAKHFELT